MTESASRCFNVSVAGFEELRLQERFTLPIPTPSKVSVAGFEELRLQVASASSTAVSQ